MNAAETIQAAIEKLTVVKRGSGVVIHCADPSEVCFRAESDTDDDGNWFSYGVIVGVDDEELADGIVTLHRTIEAQLKLLTGALALGVRFAAAGRDAEWLDAVERAGDLDLAKAILGDDEPDAPSEPDPEEHTDRVARHLDEDAEAASINAQIEGLE